MKGQRVTYKLRYWLGGKVHYTSPTYKTKDEAQKGKESFIRKYPHRKVWITKQMVVSM